MDPVRLAIVGLGVIGKRHMQALSNVEEAELGAIADPNAEVRELAQQNGVAFYAETADMLAQAKPDGVLVCTPTEHHVQPVLAVLEAGAHVLVEKPIAATLEAAETIIEAANKASRHVLVGHHRRYYSVVQHTRELLQNGELGTLIGVSGQWATRKADAYFEPDWRQLRSSGPVLTNLIHEFDTLRYCCGEIRTVSALLKSGLRGHPKEETAAVILEFESGAVGTFLLSDSAPSPWTWEQATGENPNFPKSGQNVYRFLGSKAALEFPHLILWSAETPADWNQPLTPKPLPTDSNDAYVAQIKHFCQVISGAEPPRISAQDAARTLAATLAVFESAENGQAVRPSHIT